MIKIPSSPLQYTFLFIISFCAFLHSCELAKISNASYFPEKDLGNFFHEVQMNHVFQDSKTFVDCAPLMSPEKILSAYEEAKNDPDFDLSSFVMARFRVPAIKTAAYTTDQSEDMEEHIVTHWDYLTRSPDTVPEFSSLIPLPHAYVVPGGRFREVYYWDSYFTMLGLRASNRMDLVKSMLDNFSYLINEVGFIPNGNRTYYLGRSQPPYFSSMVMLLAEVEGEETAADYLESLEKEYEFWMQGSSELNTSNRAVQRVVEVSPGVILNRYWDNVAAPRPESYVEDYELAQQFPPEKREEVYRNLRATAESGWDFSSRWFKDGQSLDSIATTEILPVDLNCLIYHLEGTIALLHGNKGNTEKAEAFQEKARQRKEAIIKYFWNDEEGFFFDYNFKDAGQTEALTLASAYPLYFQIADGEQAAKVAAVLKDKFLLEGGLATTLKDTGQQWDYPNGWAPLQWISIRGLMNYGEDQLADKITGNWIRLNEKVYEQTGKMMEKYNVADLSLEAGGGEYPNQDGFGWTNGVAISLIRKEVEH